MSKITKKDFHQIQMRQQMDNAAGELHRARSVTVGTAFGGVTELAMRSSNGSHLWCIMQPVEVIEMIHQLAANIGCHIHIQPRKDFSSWRDWKYTEEELEHYRGKQFYPGVGHPPHVNDMDPHKRKGADLAVRQLQNQPTESLPLTKPNVEPVLIQKPSKQRNTKKITNSEKF